MKELHFTTLENVGLLGFASIVLLPFVSGDALTNRCPKENPYPFRNETYCCSRPVDFEWRKDGYCYGRTQICTYPEGCVNYHPICEDINKIIAIGFPLEEYNKIYEPWLIPTFEFSHKFIFQESTPEENENSDSENENSEVEKEISDTENVNSEIHCLWRADIGNWIAGLCKNVETNVGEYFLDTDSECPITEKGWKDKENGAIVDGCIKEIKDRIALGSGIRRKFRPGGIFASSGSRRRDRIRKCIGWKKDVFTNLWSCKKFKPPIKKRKENKGGRRPGKVKLRNEDTKNLEDNSIGSEDQEKSN